MPSALRLTELSMDALERVDGQAQDGQLKECLPAVGWISRIRSAGIHTPLFSLGK
jgi:hypothetical protein